MEPPDSADLDALLELERSGGWSLVAERYLGELERNRAALETEADPVKAAAIRGAIAAWRIALAIPGIRKAEVKQQLRG